MKPCEYSTDLISTKSEHSDRLEYPEAELGETFGVYEYVKLPVDKIIVLPQVRGNDNHAQVELTESIKSTGRLLNPVDIALMSYSQLLNHLDFINGIWNTKADINDFGEPNNGIYPVLIAGHSRLKSIKTLQNEEEEPKSIVAKIHTISSSADFLSLQLAENTYNNIKPERRAMAIVEMFEYGFNKNAQTDDINHWSSHADFIRKNGTNISREVLRDGVALTKLSPEVRDFVFAGKLYYGAAVEIGKNADTIMDYAKYRLGETANLDNVNKFYNYELAILINKLIESRKNSKSGLKTSIDTIRKQILYMKESMNPSDHDSNQLSIMNMFQNAPFIQEREILTSKKMEYLEALKKIKGQPFSALTECLKLNSALTKEDLSDDIAEVQKAYKSLVAKKAISNMLER